MRPELPTGTVTFLFTDIEGSTRLLHALGPEAYAEALAEHRRLLREAFAAHGGVEVDTQGDAFFVAFPTAMGAVAAARDGQRVLEPGPIIVRMGIHTGTPTVTAEGYVGVDVHRGARIASLAHGTQTIVSPTTAALLDGVSLVDLGGHPLRDFDGATRLFQLGAGRHPPVRSPGTVELPNPATPFVGRDRELFAAVSLVLERDPRVLTIVGPGGTGKTRFAIELARLLAEEAGGGTYFVPLAPSRDPMRIVPALAETLGAEVGDPASVAARVAGKRTHVVLDNLEQLLPDAGPALAAVVGAAPELRLIVTSREALRIGAETQLDLPPLDAEDAVELFLDRARSVGNEVDRTAAVDQLCLRLDRLPLALELAAARTKLLSPEQLLERLGQRLDLLAGGRDADERHATLRATIAWSYDLLDPGEQRLFAQMSVFASGATLESIEAVCDADLDTVGSLLDKSLLRRRAGVPDGTRYWMLETIRELAAEKLAATNEKDVIRRRHAKRMLAIARSAHLTEDDDEGGDHGLALAERDDLRAALDWATAADPRVALELVVALENFWFAHAPHEGFERLRSLFDRTGTVPAPLRVRVLRVYGGAADMAGERELGERLYEEGLVLARAVGDDREIAALTHRLAMSALIRGDQARARVLADETHALAEGRFPFTAIPNYSVLGQLRIADGDVEGGTALVRRGADEARRYDWDWWLSGQLGNLLFLALDRGDLEEAAHVGTEALRIERAQENRHWALYALTGLARLALARGRPETAGQLWGAVEAESDRARYGSWASARAELGRPLLAERSGEFEDGRRQGRRLDLWDATALALPGPQIEP